MITLEAGVLRGDGTRFHDQEDRFVMIVERVLRRIKPAKEESQEGAPAKEEEENDGSQPRSRGRRLVFLIHSAARLPSHFHRSLGSSTSSLHFHIFLSLCNVSQSPLTCRGSPS